MSAPLSPIPLELQIPLGAAVAVGVLTWIGEKLHQRRCQNVLHLATGPVGRLRWWVRGVPLLRAISLAGITWGLVTLVLCTGGVFAERTDSDRDNDAARRIVFVADLSPSMALTDAGPKGDQSRAQRARDVVDAILSRLNGDLRFSVIAFYTEARPVITDARDPELVRNVFDGLPVWYVMKAGKTDLGAGVRETLKLLADFPERSATVFLCTDGDTPDLGVIPKPPGSLRDLYVLGVGDPQRGTFLDGHMSRQEVATLQKLAGRLRGQYLDVNEKHVSTLSLGDLVMSVGAKREGFRLTDWAIVVLAAAAAVQALLPVLLEYGGASWKPVRRPEAVSP